MVLVLSLPDLDASSNPDSPLQSPTSLPETPSPTSLAFSPSASLPVSPGKSRNDIFHQTFSSTPSPLSPSSSAALAGSTASLRRDKPRLAGVAPGLNLPTRERSSTGPALLPSAFARDPSPVRRMQTLEVMPPFRSDSLRLAPTAPHELPTAPSFSAPQSPLSAPSTGIHHEKSPSAASARSVSSKTSSFFDSPRTVTTPPPPPRQPTLVIRPTLPARTSSYQSAIPRSAVPSSGSSSQGSAPSPTPTPSSPPLELLELTASLSHMAAPPPISALRLSTAPMYLLGTGLTSSVYLASAKGKERSGWTLCAAKVLSEEAGVEGQQALAREEKILRWLGAGRSQARQGIVSYIGAVGVIQTSPPEDDTQKIGRVRARRRTTSITTAVPYTTFSTANETLINDVLGVSATHAAPESILLLEYLPLGTLDDFVKTHPELVDETLFVRWLGDLARGGEWLQARGIVHRDIKPQNILLSATLEPRLTDFGNSLVLASDWPIAAPESVTSGAGTLPYSSPELLQAPSKVSYPADLFSLGCTLYVILNGGKDPYRGVSGTREMVFWVSGGKFFEFEERARAASFGEGMGSLGFRRGRSLREPGKGTEKVEAALAIEEAAVASSAAASGGLRKPGSWESLRERRAGDQGSDAALAASQKAWWKPRRSAADEGVCAGQRATRRTLEVGLTAEDGPNGERSIASSSAEPPQDHLLRLLSTSPTFAPLSLSSLHPPAQIHGVLSAMDDDNPLPGPPMFFPASTPYHPLQVPESLRKLLKRMLDANPAARGTMRDVRLWAAARGWRAQEPVLKDE